ncbi:hypothetical protein HN51_028151, partial [Arachis hypogaea]
MGGEEVEQTGRAKERSRPPKQRKVEAHTREEVPRWPKSNLTKGGDGGKRVITERERKRKRRTGDELGKEKENVEGKEREKLGKKKGTVERKGKGELGMGKGKEKGKGSMEGVGEREEERKKETGERER